MASPAPSSSLSRDRGSRPLLIEKVTLEGSSSFAIATPFEGVEYGLAPRRSQTIVVTYTPTEERRETMPP